MDKLDRELLNYIAKATNRSLDEHIAFFKENVDKNPKEMICCVRGLAEETVKYLYFFIANTNTIPGPYWCLIFNNNEFKKFSNVCDENKEKKYPYPDDYQKMWEANQLLKKTIPETFIDEANSIKKLGNMASHNNPQLAQMDLKREAEKCLDSYMYLLSEVNRIVTSKNNGGGTGLSFGTRNSETSVNSRVGGYGHLTKKTVNKEKGDFASFDVKKWFAGVQAELAKERAKTQEDYDMENKNY